MIDTHAHLTCQFKRRGHTTKPIPVQLKDARNAGISHIVNIILENYTNELKSLLPYLKSEPQILISAGIHPESITDQANTRNQVKILDKFILKNRHIISAIGECGIDYFDTTCNKQMQFELFNQCLVSANKFKLPIIIHTRPSSLTTDDAYLDMYHLLKSANIAYPFVMHCFSTGKSIVKKFLDIGAYIGFDGNITYPNAQRIQEAASYTPLNRILIETDSPFLAPQAYRGQINEPAYVIEVAKKLAEIKNIDITKVEKQTDRNASLFFCTE